MRSIHTRMSFLAAALSVLLTSVPGGASGLVLCVGSDGHRALEMEHAGTACPALAGLHEPTVGTAVDLDPECLDVPTSGAAALVPPSGEPDPMRAPPLVARAPAPEPADAGVRGAMDARAAPACIARQQRFTILLV